MEKGCVSQSCDINHAFSEPLKNKPECNWGQPFRWLVTTPTARKGDAGEGTMVAKTHSHSCRTFSYTSPEPWVGRYGRQVGTPQGMAPRTMSPHPPLSYTIDSGPLLLIILALGWVKVFLGSIFLPVQLEINVCLCCGIICSRGVPFLISCKNWLLYASRQDCICP